MRFYSDKTKKFYDTLQLCEAAEREFDKQNASKTKHEEDLADEYEHAYAKLCDANKNYLTALAQSEEEVAKVLKEAKEKIKKAAEIQKAFPGYEVLYGIFSKSGFTDRMLDIAKESDDILLINEDHLIR